MGFYEEIAKEHDFLATWKQREPSHKRFFKKLFGLKKKDILDCACGTGFDIWLLSKLGHNVAGSDLNQAMLKEAKKNLATNKIKAKFYRLDFRKVDKQFRKQSFDAVLCMGNSLPHLLSEKEILKAIKSMEKILKKDGILALQIRNYDKLEKEKTRFFLRSIVKENLYFYVLDHFDKTIDFNVLRINPKKGTIKAFKTTYFKLKQTALKKLLKKAGFKQIKFYNKKADFVKISARKA